MAPKNNPLKLNPLQLRTLALLQELARQPELGSPAPDSGVTIAALPQPHGNHFHIGAKVVATADATGLYNPAVWAALERKGLARGEFPYTITVTSAGLNYDTSGAGHILHGDDH